MRIVFLPHAIMLMIKWEIMYMYLCIHKKCIPTEGYLAQGRTSFMKRHNTHVVG